MEGLEVAGLNFKDIIYEGSNDLWKKALANPATIADWIVVNPTNPDDLVAQSLNLESPTFLAHYTQVVQEPNGLSLTQKKEAFALSNYHPADTSSLHQMIRDSYDNLSHYLVPGWSSMFSTRLLMLLVLVMFLTSCQFIKADTAHLTSQASDGQDWPMFLHDPERTGTSSETILSPSTSATSESSGHLKQVPLSPPLRLSWVGWSMLAPGMAMSTRWMPQPAE